MKQYNHAFDMGFSVLTTDPDGNATTEEILRGLERRLRMLQANPDEVHDACNCYDPTDEEQTPEQIAEWMEGLVTQQPAELECEHFENLIVTALEGGSNYWATTDLAELQKKLPKELPATVEIARGLFDGTISHIGIHDTGTGGFLGLLTKRGIIRAFELAKDQHPEAYEAEIDLQNYQGDAETSDILFQLAVLGDVIYG